MRCRSLVNQGCQYFARGVGYALVLVLGSTSVTNSLTAQTAGSIAGYVLDSSRASIATAKVLVQNTATGQGRRVLTDELGHYWFPDLPIGLYVLKAEKDGFRTGVASAVKVGIGETVSVDFQLEPGALSDVIEVRSDRETAGHPPGAAFQAARLVELPINGRDYARLSLLAPGAVGRSNLIADLSFNGLHTVHNQFAIDGIDASRVDQPYMANGFERGARLLTGSLDSIEEFRVQTRGYSPQYGRAASSYLNIASKSGGNLLHGSAFEYLRNDALDARNFFNKSPAAQAEYRLNDFGASAGGPLRKGRTFYFASYEGSRQRIGITGSGTTPSAALRTETLRRSPPLAPILGQFPEGDSSTANSLVDSYTTVSVSSVREDTGSVRIDHNNSDRDSVFVRVNVNDSHVSGPLFGVIPSALGVSDFQDVPVRTSNVALHNQHVFTARYLNEFLVGMQRWGSKMISSTPYPIISVSQLTIAPGTRGRSKNNNSSFQAGDDMSYTLGRHNLKWGAAAYRIQVDYHTSSISTLAYTSLQDFMNNSATQGNFTVGNPGSATRAYQVGAYGQDAWQLRPGLTINYGLRYDFATPPFDPANRVQTFDTLTGTLAATGTPYFRANTRDFGPRASLAWQLGNHFAVRSGYGIFWQAYPVGLGASTVPLNNIAGNTTVVRPQNPALGYPLDPFLASGSHPLQTVAGFDPVKRDVYAQQWNFTLAYQVGSGTQIETAYVGNRGLDLRRNLNINYFNPALGRRPNPNFADINIEGNTGQSVYHALQVVFRRRFQRSVQFDLSYTWSHAIDDVQDQGLFSGQPQNVNNFKPERGNGSGDIRHGLSYDVIYQVPAGKGKRLLGGLSGAANVAVSGWQIASLGMFHTGVANTVLIGLSNSGNGSVTNQRPNAVLGVEPYAPHQTVDQWFNPAAFSLPDSGTFGNLGRNTVFGPGFAQLDFSLLKDTPITGTARLQFRAEVYNLPNHPNFAQPNTMFGTPNFGRIFNTFGRTLGSGTPRQIQVVLRLSF